MIDKQQQNYDEIIVSQDVTIADLRKRLLGSQHHAKCATKWARRKKRHAEKLEEKLKALQERFRLVQLYNKRLAEAGDAAGERLIRAEELLTLYRAVTPPHVIAQVEAPDTVTSPGRSNSRISDEPVAMN